MKYQLKIYKDNKLISIIRTNKKRRFLSFIQAGKKSEVNNYYLKVIYPPFTDSSGKKISPSNNGIYKNKQDLLHAWQCFTETQ